MANGRLAVGLRMVYRRLMTRTIRCKKCAEQQRAELTELPLGEGVRLVWGLALDDMLCDMCNAPIDRGEPCLAVTFFTVRQPFPDWEDEFLSAGSEGEEEDE